MHGDPGFLFQAMSPGEWFRHDQGSWATTGPLLRLVITKANAYYMYINSAAGIDPVRLRGWKIFGLSVRCVAK